MPREIQVYDGTDGGKSEHYRQQIKAEFIALVQELQVVNRVKVAELENNIRDVIDFLDGKAPFEGTAMCMFLLGQIAGEAYQQNKIELANHCHQMLNTFNLIEADRAR